MALHTPQDLWLVTPLVRVILQVSHKRKVSYMCSPAICSLCGKTTWQGCGEHIEEALAGVAVDQRCTCPR